MKKILVALVLLSVCLVMIGCAAEEAAPAPAPTPAPAPAPTPGAPKYGGVFHIGFEGSPSTALGWPAEVYSDAQDAGNAYFEGMVDELRDLTIVPCLATSWDVAPDKLSITFHLRKGVKFHDGTDFNADAVKFNYDASIAAGSANWKSVEVLDEYTVKVNLSKWTNITLAQFQDPQAWVASPTAFQKNGLEWAEDNPVGTGPFKFVSYEREVKLVTTRFDDYWDTGKPYFDGVEMVYIPDNTTKIAAMQNHTLEAMSTERGIKACYDLSQMPGIQMELEYQAVFSMIANSKDPGPLADVKVRQAVEYALDRVALSKTGYGQLNPVYQIIPEDMPAYDPNFTGRPYDPAKAKQLLAEAGYADGCEFTIWVNSYQPNRDAMAVIVDELAQVGITANVQYPDTAKCDSLAAEGWDGYYLIPIAARANYMRTLNWYFVRGGWIDQVVAYTDEYMDAFDDAMADLEPDIAKVRHIVNGIIFDNAWVVPLYGGGLSWAEQDYVRGGIFLQKSYPTYFYLREGWFDK